MPLPSRRRLRDPSRRRLRDADAWLGRAVAADPAAAVGWAATDLRVREGYRRWVASGWTGRERRLRAEATAVAARGGALRYRPGPGWGKALGTGLAEGLGG